MYYVLVPAGGGGLGLLVIVALLLSYCTSTSPEAGVQKPGWIFGISESDAKEAMAKTPNDLRLVKLEGGPGGLRVAVDPKLPPFTRLKYIKVSCADIDYDGHRSNQKELVYGFDRLGQEGREDYMGRGSYFQGGIDYESRYGGDPKIKSNECQITGAHFVDAGAEFGRLRGYRVTQVDAVRFRIENETDSPLRNPGLRCESTREIDRSIFNAGRTRAQTSLGWSFTRHPEHHYGLPDVEVPPHSAMVVERGFASYALQAQAYQPHDGKWDDKDREDCIVVPAPKRS